MTLCDTSLDPISRATLEQAIVIAPEILRFPNNDGFLFNHVYENVFGIRRNPQTTICPIKGIEQYWMRRNKSELTLRVATCFAPTTPNGGIQDSPFTLAAAEAHLKVYLKKQNIAWLQIRLGNTLAPTGAELSEIMDHVGWSNRHTALYYMQLVKVLNPCGASDKLASSEVFNIPNAC